MLFFLLLHLPGELVVLLLEFAHLLLGVFDFLYYGLVVMLVVFFSPFMFSFLFKPFVFDLTFNLSFLLEEFVFFIQLVVFHF
jgi:hypothetical protein